MTTTAVEKLLAGLEGPIEQAPRLLSDALDGGDAGEVRAALSIDRRFAPLLLRVCQSDAIVDEVRWVVRYLGAQRYRPAVEVLLRLWRKRVVGLSDQAGRALLQIADRQSMESMAADLPALPFGVLGTVSLEAAAALGELRDRALAAFADDTAARNVLAYLKRHIEAVESDRRWIAVAAEAATSRSAPVASSARELLARVLSPERLEEVLAARDGEVGLAFGPPPDPEALSRARAALERLRDALAPEEWRAPRSDQPARLEAIEAVVGPLPAMVRALYETMDGLDVAGPRPRDRVVVYGLEEAQATLARLVRDHSPATTPRDLVPPFQFPIGPDAYERRGLSGGPPIAVELPTGDDDPRLVNLRGRPKLGTYLKRARRSSKAAK